MNTRWGGVQIAVGVVVAAVLLGGLVRVGSLLLGGTESQVSALGTNRYLQLGGHNKNARHESVRPLTLSKAAAKLPITDGRAGHYHTLFLTRDGEVYAMGNNAMHTVSPSATPLIGEPTKVNFSGLETGEVITAIDSSRDHAVALTSLGRVYTWGSNYTAQLGNNTNTDSGRPVLVKGLPAIAKVTAGYRHSAAISKSGEVYAWGGVCSGENATKAQQLIDKAASNIAALGGYGSVNQTDLRSNDVGDCATLASTFVQSRTPQRLAGLKGRALQISAGYGHLLVVTDTHTLYSAGCNTYAQLGRAKSTGTNKNNLAAVTLPSSITAVSAGYRHSAVLLRDGRVWVWGYNGHGVSLQAGLEINTIAEPTTVKTQHRFVSIEAAHDTTFGVTTLGDIVGWGQDDAEAFWPLKKMDTIHLIGTTRDKERATLSAGMQHLVSIIKE